MGGFLFNLSTVLLGYCDTVWTSDICLIIVIIGNLTAKLVDKNNQFVTIGLGL